MGLPLSPTPRHPRTHTAGFATRVGAPMCMSSRCGGSRSAWSTSTWSVTPGGRPRNSRRRSADGPRLRPGPVAFNRRASQSHRKIQTPETFLAVQSHDESADYDATRRACAETGECAKPGTVSWVLSCSGVPWGSQLMQAARVTASPRARICARAGNEYLCGGCSGQV